MGREGGRFFGKTAMAEDCPNPLLRFGRQVFEWNNEQALAENPLPFRQKVIFEAEVDGNVPEVVAPAYSLHEGRAKARPGAIERAAFQPDQRRVRENRSRQAKLATGICRLVDHAAGAREALAEQMVPKASERRGARFADIGV